MGNCCCSSITYVKDTVQNCFEFECQNNERRLLWEALGLKNPTGTLVLCVLESCNGVRIYFNNRSSFEAELEAGECVIFTSDPLEKIEVECRGSSNTCKINVCLTVNYEVC